MVPVPCQQCKEINPFNANRDLQKLADEFEKVDQYPKFPSLTTSAEKGCNICKLLKDAVSHAYSDGEITKEESLFDTSIQSTWSTVRWNGRVEIYGARFGIDKDDKESDDVDAGVETDEKHGKCRQNYPQSLPTRVIDVGTNDGAQEPRLIITAGQVSPYVALSHCWGRPPEDLVPRNPRTLSTNLQSMMKGIPVYSLPQNFRDAVVTVRALGLRYLWIDALCIIQDSKRDWDIEAARMNDVYGSAYLTLIATSAKSSIDGFLARSQWPWSVVDVHFNEQASLNRPKKIHNVYLRYQPDFSNYSRTDAVDRSTWNTRGWTYQERLLSKRNLHFASGRLYWECRTTEGSEENESPRDLPYRSQWMATEPSNVQTLTIYPDEPGYDNRYQQWYRLVSNYSQRQLSFDKDVLLALEGLANAFHRIYTPEDTYRFGIWRNDFFRGLLWMTKDSDLAVRTSQVRYPSWSWASVKGELEWSSRTTARHCHYNYTAVFAEPVNDSLPEETEASTAEGTITLHGRYHRLDKVTRLQEWGALGRFPLDVVSSGQAIANGAFDVDSEIQMHGVWILQIEVQGPGDSYFPYHPTCLLMKEVHDGVGSTFSRVGYCAMNEDHIHHFDNIESNLIHIV
ncbi:MAG: hypothetical protein Q9166_005945 [cf. Caloplaca sp. 2 TL-2023]